MFQWQKIGQNLYVQNLYVNRKMIDYSKSSWPEYYANFKLSVKII